MFLVHFRLLIAINLIHLTLSIRFAENKNTVIKVNEKNSELKLKQSSRKEEKHRKHNKQEKTSTCLREITNHDGPSGSEI